MENKIGFLLNNFRAIFAFFSLQVESVNPSSVLFSLTARPQDVFLSSFLSSLLSVSTSPSSCLPVLYQLCASIGQSILILLIYPSALAPPTASLRPSV